MKIKHFLFFIPLLLNSCHKSDNSYSDNKVSLKRVDDIESVVKLTSKNQLFNIVRYDEATILITKEGCSFCNSTLTEFRDIIKKEHILIYTVDINYYLEAYNDISNKEGQFALLLPKITASPTFLFVKEGKIIDYHTGAYKENTLEEELKKHVSYSTIYSLNTYHKEEGDTDYYIDYEEEYDFAGIDTTALDNKINSDNNFTVLFSWRKCSDCKEFKSEVLRPFFNTYDDKKLYIYEVDGYYSLKNYLDENNNPVQEYLNLWYDFSAKYNLTDYEFYDKYNHRSGVVPTLLNIYSSKRKINVFRNDYEVIINDDNTLSYKHSFVSEVTKIKSDTKVNNNDTSSKEYISALKELQEKALKIEKEESLKFLEECL